MSHLKSSGEERGGAPFRVRLETELIERHRQRYGDRSSGARVVGWPKPAAMIAAAILVATVAVGAIPVRVAVGVGNIVTIDLPPGPSVPGERDLLAHILGAPFGADQVSTSVDVANERTRVLLLLFGERVDVQGLRVDLERAFPALAAGAWNARRIETDLRTSLAGMLGHRVLALELDRDARTQARSRIVEGLAAQGWTGEVIVRESDGIRMIRLEPGRPAKSGR